MFTVSYREGNVMGEDVCCVDLLLFSLKLVYLVCYLLQIIAFNFITCAHEGRSSLVCCACSAQVMAKCHPYMEKHWDFCSR